MPPNPTISGQLLAPILQHMEAKGWDAAHIAHSNGIDLSKLDGADDVIALSQYVGFMESVAKTFNAPHFGMYAAKKTNVDALGPISFLFASAPTLKDALEGLTGYISCVQEGTTNSLSISGNDVTLEYQILGNSISPRRQDAEYSIAINYEHIKNYIKGNVEVKDVRFEHQQVGTYATYANHFDCDVFFEQPSNSITFDKSILSIANPSMSKKLYPILSAHLQNIASKKSSADSMTETVKEALTSDVLSRGAKAKDVAQRLGLTSTTMARRLKHEGTSFRGLVIDRRASLAKRLLKDSTIPISHIALKLGYAETASFTRAFKTACGMTPDQYRQT